jgi:hypothetical protein
MNNEFRGKYVQQTMELLLGKTMLDESLEFVPRSRFDTLKVNDLISFSISEHTLFTIASICKAFYYEEIYVTASDVLKRHLASSSELVRHFSAVYDRVNLEVSGKYGVPRDELDPFWITKSSLAGS